MKFCCYTSYSNRKKKCIKCNSKLKNISSKKNIICLLSDDIIQKIIHKYLKSKFMFYYCNLSLVSKTFNSNFNILYKSFTSINYSKLNKPYKSIYYITSEKFKIKFAKLYFRMTKLYSLLFGEENIDLGTHKNYTLSNKNFEKYNIENLKFFNIFII